MTTPLELTIAPLTRNCRVRVAGVDFGVRSLMVSSDVEEGYTTVKVEAIHLHQEPVVLQGFLVSDPGEELAALRTALEQAQLRAQRAVMVLWWMMRLMEAGEAEEPLLAERLRRALALYRTAVLTGKELDGAELESIYRSGMK